MFIKKTIFFYLVKLKQIMDFVVIMVKSTQLIPLIVYIYILKSIHFLLGVTNLINSVQV